MPTYVYKFVDTGETIEVQQGFQDDTLTELAHPDTGETKPVKKVFTPVGVTFKGAGFFKTDNRGSTSSSSSHSGSSSESSSSSSSSDSSGSSGSSGTGSDSSSGGTSSPGSSSSASSGTGTSSKNSSSS